jgi:hypothetical protein
MSFIKTNKTKPDPESNFRQNQMDERCLNNGRQGMELEMPKYLCDFTILLRFSFVGTIFRSTCLVHPYWNLQPKMSRNRVRIRN